MAARMVTLVGTLPKLKPEDAERLAVYVVRGSEILAQSDVGTDGKFRVDLSRQIAAAPSSYALELLVGPAGMEATVHDLPKLQRVRLARQEVAKAERPFAVDLKGISLSDEILKPWWPRCRKYCYTGTVVGPNGCPAPGVDVTLYTVVFGCRRLGKKKRVTVTTDQDGRFKACFTICFCPPCRICWPVWPHWWLCWPWWWEWDILHILRMLEKLPKADPAVLAGAGQFEQAQILFQPPARDLIRGQGFACSRQPGEAFIPNAARTALIKSKLSDPAIRAHFPWWWWCCDEPSIVFSAKQGANTILNESPFFHTHWCLPNGSDVTLVGNEDTITHCPPPDTPETGFAWTRVGNITVDYIHQGYADQYPPIALPPGDVMHMAFYAGLDIYGAFAEGSGVSYYQVDAGLWSGNPARGGTAPASSAPIGADLYNHLFVYDNTFHLVFAGDVKMGPFSHDGLTGLYATQDARGSAPAGTGLDPFPVPYPLPAGWFMFWGYEGRMVSTHSSTLIGASEGAVDLTVTAYNAAFAEVDVAPNSPLTLMIDNTPLTTDTAHVNGVRAWRADGTPATNTGDADCPEYDVGPGGYVAIDVTVTDANGHLMAYQVNAERGHGVTDVVKQRGYSQNPLSFAVKGAPTPADPDPEGVDPAYDVPDTATKSFVGGEEVAKYTPPVDCCYEFRVYANKRLTNGYSSPPLAGYDFQTMALKGTHVMPVLRKAVSV